MKLIRDLKDRQLDELKKRCKQEWDKYAMRFPGLPDQEEIWKRAFSNGLRAGLEYADKIIEK
jgi:hypothetical protein